MSINDKPQKQAYIFEDCDIKGSYPLERLLILYNTFDKLERFLFVKTDKQNQLALCESYNVTPILFDKLDEVARAIRNLEIDTIIQDGKSMPFDQIELLKPFCKTYIQFDNFSDGHMLADYNVFTFVDELLEFEAPNALVGSHSFAVNDDLLNSQSAPAQETPHIAVYFEQGDINNLTYRTLRHLMQLHIPIQLSILIDDEYKHSVDELQMMLLTRKNTRIIRTPDITTTLSNATIVIGNANYTPFKVACLGIPYIALAQNEHELGNSLVKEENGFIHLGLGRKIKQSSLQNAVMELLLHDERRTRAIARQKQLAIHQNNEILETLITEFMNGQPKLTFL